MNILIDKVRIKNFRALKDETIDLEHITLLVGANNAGKTSFLRALNMIFGNSKSIFTKDDLYRDKEGNCINNTITIDIRIIPFENGVRKNAFDIAISSRIQPISNDADKEFFAIRTIITFNTGNKYTTSQYILQDWESPEIKESDKGNGGQLFKTVLMHFVDAQRDLQEDIKQRYSYFGKLMAQLEDNYSESDIKEIKKIINNLNDKTVSASTILSELKIKLSKLKNSSTITNPGISITPTATSIRDLYKNPYVSFQDENSDAFALEHQGTGIRSRASIYTFGAYIDMELAEIDKKIQANEDTDLLFPILALEEPEAHLHPNAQRILYQQLKDFAGQKIVSTHSPYIAAQAELNELRHFYKENEAVKVSKIDTNNLKPNEIQKIKENIESSKGEVLFSNAVIMTEGKTELVLLPQFIKAYFGKSDFELGITVSATGKNYPLLYLLKPLHIKWFIFSDYDKQQVKSDLKSILTHNNVTDMVNIIKLNDEITEDDIEAYLYKNGYEDDLKNALKKLKEPEYTNEQHRAARQSQVEIENTRIDALSTIDFLEEMKSWKVKAARIYIKTILDRTDDTRFPPKIRELMERIAATLNIKKI